NLVPKLERLHQQHQQAELLQTALYAIADLASSAEDMPGFYRALHRIIAKLTYAENFYIVLYDGDSQMVNFVYFVDTVDQLNPWLIPLEKIKRGLTAYVLRTGRPLLGSREVVRRMIA